MAGRHGRSGSTPIKISPPSNFRKVNSHRRLSTPQQAEDAILLNSRAHHGADLAGSSADLEAQVRAMAGRKAVSAPSPSVASNTPTPTSASPIVTTTSSSSGGGGGDGSDPGRAPSSLSHHTRTPAALARARGVQARAQRQAVNEVLLEAKNQQLRGCAQRLRAAWSPGNDPWHVDGAFEEYAGMQRTAMNLVRNLVAYPAEEEPVQQPPPPPPPQQQQQRQSRGEARRRSFGGGGGARHGAGGSVEETVERLEMLSIGGRAGAGHGGGDGGVNALGASLGAMGLSEEGRARGPAGLGRQQGTVNEGWLRTIREWRAAVQRLFESHRTSLAVTYQACERGASAQAAERILSDVAFRTECIHRMRNALNYEAFTTEPAFWPRYEERFRNYDCLKKALKEIDRLLQWERDGGLAGGGEDDKGDSRPVRKYTIAPRGDAILEFANTGDTKDEPGTTPVLRFRVSSHMLAETSPFFARLFSENLVGSSSSRDEYDDDNIDDIINNNNNNNVNPTGRKIPCLPPCLLPYHHPQNNNDHHNQHNHNTTGYHHCPPRAVTCADGTRANLYSLPHAERNEHDALAILLHAAHAHTRADQVPRAVGLAQFAALAAACLRYACTAPLEVFVEHLWLPAWVHEAAGPQPDELVLISYVFGLRRLFARVSKTAVLNIVDEEELAGKGWPQRVRDRIWAVRNAKIAQVYAVCTSTVQEYFRPPMGHHTHLTFPRGLQTPTASGDAGLATFALTSTPRCPRGSHACDAAGLGWLLLVLNELHLLGAGASSGSGSGSGAGTDTQPRMNPSLLSPAALSPSQRIGPRRSLTQLLDALRRAPGLPTTTRGGGGRGHLPHEGVCDPARALRVAVDDVYNSVVGLTLFEVDGRRHGWALSRAKAGEPQGVGGLGAIRLGVLADKGAQAGEDDDVNGRCGSTTDEAVRRGMEAEEGVADVGGGHGLGLRGEEPGHLDTDTEHVDIPHEGHHHYRRHQHPHHSHKHHPALSFHPDEPTCLRILSHLDTSADLSAAAQTSRAFYAAYRNNELALLRRLVRARPRQLTLSALRDRPRQSRGLLLTCSDTSSAGGRMDALGSELSSMSEGPDSGCVMTDDGSGDGDDDDEEMKGKGRGVLWSTQRSSASLADGDEAVLPASYADAVVGDVEGSSYGMTEEEAHRILWPDQSPDENEEVLSPDIREDAWRRGSGHPHHAQPRNGGSEKVPLNHVAFVEEKTLIAVGDKFLREQYDRRIGILGSEEATL